MTEPVAYRVDGTIYNDIKDAEFAVREIEHLRSSLGIDNGLIRRPVIIESLYTSEQLHQRVKMTQAEFDEWNKLVEEVADLYTVVIEICDISHYPNLYFRFFDLHNDDTDKTRETQVEFAKLWGVFDEFNPEETIEVVPNMKWFVRSKERNADNNYYYFIGKRPQDLFILYGYKRAAKQFDTKEESEKWTNPDTEAVHLPVEGE
ncbi:hypothetical protein [Leuconostoc lactis]|uniref:hypothetical protein n=1 Tax=Leuconostoc lactis TaxID=1246 RepID=UPI0006DCEF90|nr:hypothetical protein [Leuconostoc lactis]